MKKNVALLLLMAAMLVAVPAYNTAWAAQRGPANSQQDDRGPGYGPHHRGGYNMPEMTQEQVSAYEKIMTDHHNKTQNLRNDLWAKQTELDYLSRNQNADPKTISKLVGEVKDLRVKLQNEYNATAGKISKDLGINTGHAHGIMRGYGGGYGMGPYGMGGGMGCSGYDHGGGFHNGGRR